MFHVDIVLNNAVQFSGRCHNEACLAGECFIASSCFDICVLSVSLILPLPPRQKVFALIKLMGQGHNVGESHQKVRINYNQIKWFP